MIGIFLGRLMPPTIMHQKIINNMKYDKVYIILVEGTKTSFDKKNFLSFDDRKKILKITNPNVDVIHSTHGYIPDIIKDNNLNKNNDDVYIVAGSDRIQGYLSQFKKVTEYKVYPAEIPRQPEDVSATKIRTALLSNDYGTYKKMIARGLDNEKWFLLLKKKIELRYEI